MFFILKFIILFGMEIEMKFFFIVLGVIFIFFEWREEMVLSFYFKLFRLQFLISQCINVDVVCFFSFV